ncbi:hypothetical protein [Loktanella salsilacus]|uniref:hypothetical protein n=1 Tax=Loktanella salsilacus TaxID=195913 RepID=UPI0037353429
MSDVVSLIPEVKPWLAMKALHSAVRNETHGVSELNAADRNLIWRQDRGRRTSPIGGRILVNLFHDGRIQQNLPASEDISALIAYSEGVDDFRDKVLRAIDELHRVADQSV